MNKIGSLYQVKQWYWLLFPNKEIIYKEIGKLAAAAYGDANDTDLAAAYFSNQFNCNVTCFYPEDIVFLLETDGKFKKLLTTKGEMGWTWFEDRYSHYFEEVTQP